MVDGTMAQAPHPTFACLWCGRSWTVRAPDDLEGFAKLCPDCLGKAGDNEFLRFRLRAALEARAAQSATASTLGSTAPVAATPVAAAPVAQAPMADTAPAADPDMV